VYWTMHYPRVSEVDPSQVAFTPEEAWGEQDRQLRMKPGRYLQRYFGEVLEAHVIEQWALQYSVEHEVQTFNVAMTPDEIEDVYLHGPSSCMSHLAGEYQSNEHPTRVYGAGDLGIAYLGPMGSATARCLVWPEKRVYGRIYGDEARMQAALVAAGYTRADTFDGARLLYIEQDDTFILPYLDSPTTCVDIERRERKQYLILRDRGDYEGGTSDHTTGLQDAGRSVWCERCENRVHPDDTTSVGDETWCDDCAREYAATCRECCETSATDNMTVGPDDEYRCDQCHTNRFTTCDDCGEEIDRGEAKETPDGDGPYCESCYADNVSTCDDCGEECKADDLTTAEDGKDYCEDCLPQHGDTEQLDLIDGEEVSERAA